jgi:phage baseplate assembly protein W
MSGASELETIWPDLKSRGLAAPVGVGMDPVTGKVLVGWPHTQQQIERLFTTRFHERVLRRWCGSYVPHLLGELVTRSLLLRFFGGITTAIDLWEPRYSVETIYLVTPEGNPANIGAIANKMRIGQVAFRTDGIYMPRGHLGDMTPETRRTLTFGGNGNGNWERLDV